MADVKPDLDELIAWADAVIAEGLLSPDLHKTGRILLGLSADPVAEGSGDKSTESVSTGETSPGSSPRAG